MRKNIWLTSEASERYFFVAPPTLAYRELIDLFKKYKSIEFDNQEVIIKHSELALLKSNAEERLKQILELKLSGSFEDNENDKKFWRLSDAIEVEVLGEKLFLKQNLPNERLIIFLNNIYTFLVECSEKESEVKVSSWHE